MSLLSFLLTNLIMMGGVAFFTLLERKYLGYFQLRVGPNKVGLKGVPQPIADAMKLFLKEMMVPDMANKVLFMVGPCLMLILCVSVWVLYPVKFGSVYYLWGVLLFASFSSAGIYGVLMVGWSSNSKYAHFGCVRAVAQFISYEVVMILVMLTVVLASPAFDFTKIERQGISLLGMLSLVFLLWLVCLLAETNRAPFDFVEGESELVSGFNVEYGGVGFALIFIAEYSMILFMSVITVSLFWGGAGHSVFVSCLISFLVSSFVILSRGALPRFRYDLLMGLTWKFMLPIILAWLGLEVLFLCYGSLCSTLGWSPKGKWEISMAVELFFVGMIYFESKLGVFDSLKKLVPAWQQLGISDPVTMMAKSLIYYHDLTCLTMVMVGSGIGIFLLSFYLCSFWSKAVKKNEKVEFWWSLLPGMWLAFLSYPSLSNLYKMECEASAASTIVSVIGHQWNWEYNYGDFGRGNWFVDSGSWEENKLGSYSPVEFGYISHMQECSALEEGDFRLMEVDRRLILPLGKSLLSITSADVIHSWFVPSLGVKMDAVPGKHNIVDLVLKRCGINYGNCAEICGVNHSYMPVSVEVLSEEFFNKWLSEMSSCLENAEE